MPIEFYKIIHIVAALAVFSALGGILMATSNGATKETNVWRKKAALSHGIGLIALLVSGFGLLAKNGLSLPMWAVLKLFLWLGLGGMLALAYRVPAIREKLWWGLLAIGLLATFVGISWRVW